MGRGGLSRVGRFFDAFNQGYDTVGKVQKGMAISSAADVKPEEQTAYTQDQAQQLEAAASAKDAVGNPLYNVQANEGGTYSVTPTSGG